VAVVVATGVSAQVAKPREPVPLYADSDLPPCSTATIANLEARDGFLSVRAGPSRRERELARLSNGDAVFACVRDGDWFGIVFERPGENTGCGVDQPVRVARDYAGPCRSGWVYERYIVGYADWISP
jgi:hypothetical protein